MDETTATDYDSWDLKACALQFGRDLRRWRRRCGWAQDTSMVWGKAAQIPHVFSSTWSQLERGLMSTPGPKVFLSLADQNRRIAAGDFAGVTDRNLMNRLRGAMPVAHEDGEPWDAADYYACYIGLLAWPHPAVEPPTITPDDASRWSHELRALFRSTADELKLSPVEATVQVLERGPEDRQEREQLQRVLLGFDDFSAAELLDLWREDGDTGSFDVLDRWRQSHGLAAADLAPPWQTAAGQ
jgi:transcriptional regulator with XRE-family HTH domain